MFIKPQNLSLTLFVSILLTLAIASVEANDFAHPNRRDHDNLKRLIRKRSPFPAGAVGLDDLGGLGTNNVAPDPNKSLSASQSASASASASAVSESASASVSASVPSQSASASASLSASASESSAFSPSSTSSKASTTASASAPGPTEQAQTGDPAIPTSHEKSTVTRTDSTPVNAAAVPTNTISPSSAAATKTKITVTTVLIVVAASVGGVFILWTVFRKWKLGHSSKFNERMAPIDWQPTNDDGIVPAHRRANSRASSFHSSSNHDNSGAGGFRGLEHDFSAPPAHLAPVGGYADLARGSSPQPQMQEALGRGPSMNRAYNDGLARGPSTTRPAYDTGVPLHHQAGYGQAEAYDYNGDAVRF